MSPRKTILTPAALLLVGSVLPVVPATAGWSTDPVAVRPTTTPIPVVAACNDGGFGTFAVWQEGAASAAGALRAQHILSTGDSDPAWPPDGALVCTTTAKRATIGAVPDHLGGMYVWWVETTTSPSLFVTRLDPSGTVAAGWPAAGLGLGSISSGSQRPSVIDDGATGVYLAWSLDFMVRARHLGANGLGAGGWPNSSRVVVGQDPTVTTHLWPDLALGPDGGVFCSWATWSSDTTAVESGMHLRRLTSAGFNSPGWPPEGLSIAPLRPEGLPGGILTTPLIDISPDGRGGVFLVQVNLWEEGGTGWINPLLYRLLGDGQSAPDWPAEGRPISNAGGQPFEGGGPDGGVRVYPDGFDGAIAEKPDFFTDSPPMTGLVRFSAGGVRSWGMEALSAGHESAVKPDGGVYLADFHCCGPMGPFAPGAFTRVDQSNPLPGWTAFSESHNEPALDWFGDIGLASTGDGGAVLFWSQTRDRFGLFARRFNPAGQVTRVAPGPAKLALHGVRFAPGSGVVARMTLDGASARLDLFDVSGRRIAARSVEGVGLLEVTLAGTSELHSGLYFARLSSGSRAAFGKVAIAR